MTLGAYLRGHRLRLEWTQLDLSRAMATHGGVPFHPETLSRYERGTHCPGDPTLAVLLRVLHVPEVEHDQCFRLARDWRIARSAPIR